jgi:hypothetical protein
MAAIAFVSVALGATAHADTIVMTFTACIDGRDLLLIQGSTVQWQVVDYIPPGVPPADCPANPTIISTTLNGQKVVDKFQWFPIFDYPAPAGSLSSVLGGLNPPLPSSDMQVTARVIQARGSEGIQQLPTRSNDYTLILNFDDEEALGEGLYTIEVTIVTP